MCDFPCLRALVSNLLYISNLKQVCSDGDAGTETSKSYTCRRPLKGLYLTVQKTKSVIDSDEVLFINEVDVEVVTL